MNRRLVTLCLGMGLVFAVTEAHARGNIWTAKAIKALESLVNSTGQIGATTNSSGALVTVTGLHTGRHTFGSAADAANAVDLNLTAGCVAIEGSTADADESLLCAADPTEDQTFNLPNPGAAASYTLAALSIAQTWTVAQSFSVAPRPTTDLVSDLGTSALRWKDAYVAGSVQGAYVQTLADNVAEDFVEIGCPAGDGSGGTISYVAYAENGTTEAQQETGVIQFNCLNLAGTEVCAAPTEQGTPLHNETTGGTADLTTAWACTVGLTSVVRINATVNTGIATPTLVNIRYRVNVHSGAVAVTALE